jgi:hypothetical protein
MVLVPLTTLLSAQFRSSKDCGRLSEWPHGLRRSSAAARMLNLGSNSAGSVGVCREYCVLLRRGLCDELVTRPAESYRVKRMCDVGTSRWSRSWLA